MVSILPSGTPGSLIGADVGRALQSILPGAVQQGYNRGLLQNSLGNIQKIASNPNSSPLDVTLAAMQAGAGIPGSERYLGQIIPMLQQLAAAKSSQQAPLAGEMTQPRIREPIEQVSSRRELPTYLDQKETPQFFPDNIGPQGGPGNVPQEATARVKEPLLATSEYPAAAKKLAAERTAAGIPTTPREALNEIKENEQAKKAYNQEIDKELSQRVEGQKTYGDRAVEYLTNLFPGDSKFVTDEMKALFQKKGEEASKRGDSEADINRYLSNEAKRFKNSIVNAEKSLSAPRLQNFIKRKFQGEYKNFEESSNDLKKHLQPLLDDGLFDTARSLLDKLGYAPEEREIILHPLSPESIALSKQLPEVKSPFLPSQNFQRQPSDIGSLKDFLIKVKTNDPNFSPLLARKLAMDRGYDWKEFSQAWNDLLNEGFEPTQDQAIMSGYLDTPPLSTLEQILENLNIIGR